jgi:hypothetical protein
MATQKLTAADEKALVRYGLDKYDRNDTAKLWTAENPFSGDIVAMNEFMYHLYLKICNLYQRYCNGETGKVVQEYDRLKYIMLKLDSDAYMRLID